MYFSPDTIEYNHVVSRTRWKAVQVLKKMFWRRFIQEYLPTLQIGKTWNKVQGNLKQNELVLVRENSIPRFHWPLVRVIKTYPRKDGIFRSAKIKLPNSILTRPCNKLCMLVESDC